MNKEIILKIKEIIFKSKHIAIIMLVIVIGFIFMILSNIFQKPEDVLSDANLSDYELQEYTKALEDKLTQVVSEMQGAGKTKVMITLESSFENVFASNASIGESGFNENGIRNTQKELVLSNSKDLGDVPIIVKQISPKIKGVVIVCEGGNDPLIKEQIINASAVVFNISTNRIYVTGGTG